MVIKEATTKDNHNILTYKECNDASKIRIRRLKRLKKTTEQINTYMKSIL